MSSIHSLTTVKSHFILPEPSTASKPNTTIVEADSKATCSCGWSSDWQPTEQLAREEYGRHVFMGVKSPFIHYEKDWPS